MTDIIINCENIDCRPSISKKTNIPIKKNDCSFGRDKIFIDNMLSILDIRINYIENGEKQFYYCNKYKISCMYNDNYIYLKIVAHETILKIVVTDVIYYVNFIKDGNIILVTTGSKNNIATNPKICTDDIINDYIMSEIYRHHVYEKCENYVDNKIGKLSLREMDNIAGLYYAEYNKTKYFRYICIDQQKYIKDCLSIEETWCGFNAQKYANIITIKCNIKGLYLAIKICDDNNLLSKYYIPLSFHNMGYFVEKQYNINNELTHYLMCDSTENFTHIDEYFTSISTITQKLNLVKIKYYMINNTYIHEIFNNMNNIIKNNFDDLFKILASDSIGSFILFYNKISVNKNVMLLYYILYYFIHNEKITSSLGIIGGLIEMPHTRMDVYFKKYKYNELFENNDDTSDFEHKIDTVIKYFIDSYTSLFSIEISESIIKMIYDKMVCKKKEDIISIYDGNNINFIMDKIVSYREKNLYSIIWDEEKYWIGNEDEGYYDYTVSRLYDMELFERKDFNININNDTTIHFSPKNDMLVYEYGNFLKKIIVECGNGQFKLSSTKIDKQKQSVVSFSKEEIDKDIYKYMKLGEEKNKHNVITKNIIKKNSHGIDGYKAGITEDGSPCIIVLRIFPSSIVAFDKKLAKYRTNRCSVKNIYKVNIIQNNNGDYKITHNIPIHTTSIDGICPICCSNEATQVAYPCKHNLCLQCWMYIISSESPNKCPYCRQNIEHIDYIPNKNIMDTINKYETAYSFISTHRMPYNIGQTIEIKDFDKNMNAVCRAGIHFHLNIEDTYKWFEYLLIPDHLRLENYNRCIDDSFDINKKFTTFHKIIENVTSTNLKNIWSDGKIRALNNNTILYNVSNDESEYDIYEFIKLYDESAINDDNENAINNNNENAIDNDNAQDYFSDDDDKNTQGYFSDEDDDDKNTQGYFSDDDDNNTIQLINHTKYTKNMNYEEIEIEEE